MQTRGHVGLRWRIVLGACVVGLMTACASPLAARNPPTASAAAQHVAMSGTPVVTGAHATASAAPSPATQSSEPAPPARPLPVSVQSDAAMRRAGNTGPTSSILAPASCALQGATVTARGGYAGGLAPQVYPRYGDVIDLYVYTAPQPGYPDGIQLATPFTPHSPGIGGRGPWTVTVPVDRSLGVPARCVVAAQPTHDFQGAPSAY